MASAPRSYGLARALQQNSALPLRVCSRCLPSLRSPRNTRAFSATTAMKTALSAFKIPQITNEPNPTYAKGSAQREALLAAVAAQQKKGTTDVPLVIGGKEIHTAEAEKAVQRNPSDHATAVARYSLASTEDINNAIDAAMAAKPAWESMSFTDRAAIFLKAADLISTKYRYEIMATTMLGQGKNMWQAEIDAAAELIDFLRFNVKFAEEMYSQQPHNSTGVWNRVEYRPLEGFVWAVSPFNFTAIGGNLVGAPALLGNVVVWKPSDSAVASGYLLYKILLEAGLPPNVIQFVPGNPEKVTQAVVQSRHFAALHFTGSTAVFLQLQEQISKGTAQTTYDAGYARVVGETGGKNFHIVHPSADIRNAVVHTVRGAFEYSGQKCSATSRLYVAKSIWPQFKEELVRETEALRVGAAWDPATFVGPVIHDRSFNKLRGIIDSAKDDSGLELLTGGTYDNAKGYFVRPTIYEAKDPQHAQMRTEAFGPLLTAYVYDDAAGGSDADQTKAFRDACALVNGTGSYGLTGSVFARDRAAIRAAEEALRHCAGNFYINCKSTGAVVGQQPFGGARRSGTNDKAGSANILARFVSPRSIKEEFVPCEAVGYPSNEV
ncbi:delta-1-pyrroline-5-carboxylate dehydrogenase 1 [Hypoxylon sp. FL1284]|nr:delta-1-pyrroline-5-carboxylate dehydrogenase 1 [Hypoxylon sp. FL1284]